MSIFLPKAGLSISFINMLLGASNWLFWFLSAKLVEPREIGVTSSIFNTAILFSFLAFIGIEYSLLKNSSKDKSYFGSILIFELLLHLSLIPILILFIQQITDNMTLFFISIIILFSTLFTTVSNFSLLGVLSVKKVSKIQIGGVITKIVLLVLFLHIEFGSIVSMLLAITSQSIFTGVFLFFPSLKRFGLHFNRHILKHCIIEGISNFPPKLTIILQSFGVISLLAFFGISNEKIAGFTISIGILIFINGVSTGFSQMIIPSSTIEKKELSHLGAKMSMGIAVPLISIILVSPQIILGIYNTKYSEFSDILMILSLSFIPFMLTTNTISMLNNLGKMKNIILIGVIESGLILSLVIFLIPSMGVTGAAWAITIGAIGSGVISFFLTIFEVKKIFIKAITSIMISFLFYMMIQSFNNQILILITSFFIPILCIFSLKLIRISEAILFIKQLRIR